MIKNTIEFDPDILKRYVNFMSNPDERTAVDQFGSGDKCFGVATMMSTLPGLPMFGHGQIEGFTEKYGMEFRRARYQEDPDRRLVERHDRQIAPLLHQRWLFAESENFLLYDFYRPDGSVDENVFAYSNRRGEHRALIVYHNRFATTQGTIHHSATYADKAAGHLRSQSLGAAFALPNDGNVFLAYRDVTSGLEHLERSSKIVSNGFSLELQAYKCHVFLNWRELRPSENYRWDLLCESLNGRGVPNLDEALLGLELAPLHDSLVSLLETDVVENFALVATSGQHLPACAETAQTATPAAQLLQRLEGLSLRFAGEGLAIYARKTGQPQVDAHQAWQEICAQLHAAAGLPGIEVELSEPWSSEAKAVLPSSNPEIHAKETWGPVLAFCVLEGMARSIGGKDTAATALALFDQLRLREPLARAFSLAGETTEDGWRAAARVRLAFLKATLTPAKPVKPAADDAFAGFPRAIWEDPNARWLLRVNESGGEWYFNKELHEQMLWWLQLPDLLELAGPAKPPAAVPKQSPKQAGAGKSTKSAAKPAVKPIGKIEQAVQEAHRQAEESGYRIGEKKEVVATPKAKAKSAKREKGALAK